jgi:hypothetical protein
VPSLGEDRQDPALKPDLVLTFSGLQADIAAHSIRRGLDVHERDLGIVAALGRAFGHTNMGVYAEIVAGGESRSATR